jgi:hypothetical protein
LKFLHGIVAKNVEDYDDMYCWFFIKPSTTPDDRTYLGKFVYKKKENGNQTIVFNYGEINQDQKIYRRNSCINYRLQPDNVVTTENLNNYHDQPYEYCLLSDKLKLGKLVRTKDESEYYTFQNTDSDKTIPIPRSKHNVLKICSKTKVDDLNQELFLLHASKDHLRDVKKRFEIERDKSIASIKKKDEELLKVDENIARINSEILSFKEPQSTSNGGRKTKRHKKHSKKSRVNRRKL